MSLKIQKLKIDGAVEYTTVKHLDERGFFARTFCQNELVDINNGKNIIQMNISHSKVRGTVRGMHIQMPPFQEDKIVRCISGAIFDVLVDCRESSKTYGQSTSVELSSTIMNAVYIPKGVAHGFQTLEDNTQVLYCHTEIHSPLSESGFRYDSEALGIQWPLPVSIISNRDKNLPKFVCEK